MDKLLIRDTISMATMRVATWLRLFKLLRGEVMICINVVLRTGDIANALFELQTICVTNSLFASPGSLGYLPRCSAHRATLTRPRWRIGK